MGERLPDFATDVLGRRQIVWPGENGLLVPPRDAAALAEAIRRLAKGAPLRTRMGVRGREMAVAEFSEELVIGRTLAVYKELLGNRWPATAGAGAS